MIYMSLEVEIHGRTCAELEDVIAAIDSRVGVGTVYRLDDPCETEFEEDDE